MFIYKAATLTTLFLIAYVLFCNIFSCIKRVMKMAKEQIGITLAQLLHFKGSFGSDLLWELLNSVARHLKACLKGLFEFFSMYYYYLNFLILFLYSEIFLFYSDFDCNII